MLLDALRLFHIGDGIVQKKGKAILAEQGSGKSIGWPVWMFVRDKFGIVLNHFKVVVGKNFILHRIVLRCQQTVKIEILLFAEIIKFYTLQ